MTLRISSDWRPFLDEVVELELAASRAYAEFVHPDLDAARSADRFLLASGPCEFGEPHAVVALEGDVIVGLLCLVPGAELATLRLQAAVRFRHPEAPAMDPAASARVRLARRALLKPLPADLYLSRIAVAPARQGRGVGRILMDHVFERGRALGAERVVLEVHPDSASAVSLYRLSGFEILATPSVHDPASGRTLRYNHMAAAVP